VPTWVIVTVTVIVLLGVTAFLIGSLLTHIRRERRSSNVRRVWANFGLSITFCLLFLISWGAQALAEWGLYRDEQAAHGEPATMQGYLVEFGQSTFENWQSEFLQLFSFVVLAALLIHRGSAESKDGTDRIERKVDQIARRLDELAGSTARR
jgi:succinate dehydrogenase hydrophobic anchor subunit